MSNAAIFELDFATRRSPVPTADGGYLGDLVSWQLGSLYGQEFSVDRALVRQVFIDAGFDWVKLSEGCARTNPTYALCEAVRRAQPGRNRVIKQLARPNRDTPVAFGIYERQARDEGGDDLVPGARVRIEQDLPTALPPEGKIGIISCVSLACAIESEARLLLSTVQHGELSELILCAGRSLGWAPFRRAGGAYYLRPDRAQRFRALMDGLEKISFYGGYNRQHFFATVQPLFGDSDGRTAKNVRDASTALITDELAELAKDLEKAQAGKIQKRAIETRVTRCQELLILAQEYSDVLADRLAELEGATNKMRDQFGAMLKTDPLADKFNF